MKDKRRQKSTNKITKKYKLKKPNAVKYSRKNDILPFENETPLEFFSQKNDCSLFAFASHTKKVFSPFPHPPLLFLFHFN